MIHFLLAVVLPIVAARIASLLTWAIKRSFQRWQKNRHKHRKIKSDVAQGSPKLIAPGSPRRFSAPDRAAGGPVYESVGATSPGTPPVAARTRGRKHLCGVETL